jgi:wyosine [tRNA(Phe)-imidazoG37] synthetase (radical SAM superfamily)
VKYVFGPVPSRRLGNSLGVDLVPFKTCPFNCVYCQLGRTTHQTSERASFVPADEVLAEVRAVVASRAAMDYITISGSGEPTLSLDLGRVVRGIKAFTSLPVAVLTNSALLGHPDVRADLAEADLVVPSFDAGTQAAFERVNRPLGMTVEGLAEGLVGFTRAFRGQVWLEVLVVRGVNDAVAEAEAIVAALRGGRFDQVQLNTVVRAPAEPEAGAATRERLAELAAVLAALAPVEVIGTYEGQGHAAEVADAEASILAALERRPCGAAELAASLGLEPALVARHLASLARAGRVERILVAGQPQFRARHG